MEFNSHIFRDYDVRGIPGKDFGREFCYYFGLAAGNFIKGRRICLSRDARESGIWMKEEIKKGLVDAGKEVWDLGMVPTPVNYFAICFYGLDGGLQVTASHLPPEWNGIKVSGRGAVAIGASNGLEEIRQMVGRAEKIGRGKTRRVDAVPDYIRLLSKRFRGKFEGLDILIDASNGAVGKILEKIFREAGAKARTLNARPDMNSPSHVPDPHKEDAFSDVLKEEFDIAFVLDGDGDRCGVAVDGRIVSPDSLLIAFSKDALGRRRGIVVGEVRSSMAWIEEVEEAGGKFVMAKAGHTNIIGKIKETGAVFGGEVSSHFFFPLDYYLFDDGVFSALKAAEIFARDRECFDKGKRYFASKEYSIPSSDEEKFRKVDEIRKIAESRGWKVLAIDGVRAEFEDGWLLVRASNTSPKIKARFEGKTEEAYERMRKRLESLLKEAGINFPIQG